MTSESEDDDDDTSPWSDSDLSGEDYQEYWNWVEGVVRRDYPRRYHRKFCLSGNLWSHAFEHNCWCDDNGQIQLIGQPDLDLIEYFDKTNWQKMRDDIRESTVLEGIDLSRNTQCYGSEQEGEGGVFVEYLAHIFEGLQPQPNLPCLETFQLSENSIGAAGIGIVIPFIKSFPMIQVLNLNSCALDNEAVILLSDALEHVRIEILHMCSNYVEDEGVECLLAARNAKYIKALTLIDNPIGLRGYETISHFLRRDDIEFRHLLLRCLQVEFVEILLQSMSKKSRLRTLDVAHESHGEEFRGEFSEKIQPLLCDTTSFKSICESNHHLYDIGCALSNKREHQTLKDVLEINSMARRGESTSDRVKNKLRRFYFNRRCFDITPFSDMSSKLMHHILEVVTQTEMYSEVNCSRGPYILGTGFPKTVLTRFKGSSGNLNAVYRVLKHCNLQELFGFTAPDVKINELEGEIAALRAELIKQ